MSMHIKKSEFGNKGKDKYGATYAQMLLSGEPMERRKSMEYKTAPKFKPRRKQAFGKKADELCGEQANASATQFAMFKGWGRKALWIIGVGVMVQLALTLGNFNLPRF